MTVPALTVDELINVIVRQITALFTEEDLKRTATSKDVGSILFVLLVLGKAYKDAETEPPAEVKEE